jgi:hypothetical protein
MHRFDPFALFFDQPEGGLLKDALVLSRVGVEVLVAGSVEEAREILRAQGQRPGVVMFSMEVDRTLLPALVGVAQTTLSGGSGSLVGVGHLGGRSSMHALRELGVKWLVQAPFSEDELHLGLTAALAEGSWPDVRKSPRVPITVPVTVMGPHGGIPGTVQDLSTGGLFLATATPPAIGTRLSVELAIGHRTLAFSGRVIHLCRRLSPRGEVGLGLSFGPLREEDARALGEFVRARLGSVRL